MTDQDISDIEKLLRRRPHGIPCIIAAAMLLGALGQLPYAYYEWLRIVTCAAAVFVAWIGFFWKQYWATCLFGLIAALWNPFVPVHLARETWRPLDMIGAFLFGFAALFVRPEKER